MIPERNPYNNWNGNGSTKTFDFDFLIEDETQLIVYHTNSSGVQTVLTYGTDYSINELGNENGSFITFPLDGSSYEILGSDEVVSLCLTLPISQENPFGKSSYLNLETLEYVFDYIIRICQIMNRELERSVKTPEGSDQSAEELIEALNEAQVNAANSAAAASASATAANDSAIASSENVIIATQQAQIATEKAEEVLACLTDYVLTDLSNITNEGINIIKTNAISAGEEKFLDIDLANSTSNTINTINLWGVPDYSAEVSIPLNTTFIPDSNGIVKIGANTKIQASQVIFYVGTDTSTRKQLIGFTQDPNSTLGVALIFTVKKGEHYSSLASNSNSYALFYPFIGETTNA